MINIEKLTSELSPWKAQLVLSMTKHEIEDLESIAYDYNYAIIGFYSNNEDHDSDVVSTIYGSNDTNCVSFPGYTSISSYTILNSIIESTVA